MTENERYPGIRFSSHKTWAHRVLDAVGPLVRRFASWLVRRKVS